MLAPTFPLSVHAIETGLQARQPCRFEVIKQNPLIILDVAHNPNGLTHLFQAIKQAYPHSTLRLLFGLSKSKDISACLAILMKNSRHFHLVEAPNGRGIALQDLFERIETHQDAFDTLSQHSSIHEGVRIAREKASEKGEILVICGSFFIMADVREALGIVEPRDDKDFNEKGFLTPPRFT